MKRIVALLVAWKIAGMYAAAQVGILINYGAVVKDSLRVENSAAFVRVPAGGSIRWGDINVGTLATAALGGPQSWILPDESGMLLTSATQFAASTTSHVTVSGVSSGLDIQLKSGSVMSSHIADGTITDSDISPTAAISIGKLAAGSNGQVLATIGTGAQWSSLASLEDDPQVGTFGVGQVAFWGGTALMGNSNLYWDNTNARLGIGTSTPTASLDVSGSARLARSASTTVVIGNVAADGKLRVDGSIRADGYRSADGTAGIPAFRFTNSASTGMFSPTSNHLAFSTNGSERIRLDASGNVGIGTTTPTTRLTVAGTISASQLNGALQYGITAGAGLSGGTFDNSGNITFALTNTGVTAGTYGSATTVPQITVDAQGRITNVNSVSISLPGESDPTAWKLTGNSGTTTGTHFLGTTDNQALVIKINNTEAARFTTDRRLDLTGGGGSYRIDLPNNSNLAVGRIRAQGYATYSSRAWKEEIRPIVGALEKVLRLEGMQYRWKLPYGGTRDIGFIMEDVADVVPEVVDHDPITGEYLGMDYSRLTALLVEALKEEHRRNDELRAELAQLRGVHKTLEDLRSEIERLRGIVERQIMRHGSNLQSQPASEDRNEFLGDNKPNPHDGTTTVPCYVPAGVGSAELIVSDAAGRTIRSVMLDARDAWTNVTLDLTLLSSGTYEYRLVLDGRVVATKQMQLVR